MEVSRKVWTLFIRFLHMPPSLRTSQLVLVQEAFPVCKVGYTTCLLLLKSILYLYIFSFKNDFLVTFKFAIFVFSWVTGVLSVKLVELWFCFCFCFCLSFSRSSDFQVIPPVSQKQINLQMLFSSATETFKRATKLQGLTSKTTNPAAGKRPSKILNIIICLFSS